MYVGQQDTAQSADIWGKFVSDGSADMWGVETVRGESGAEYGKTPAYNPNAAP